MLFIVTYLSSIFSYLRKLCHIPRPAKLEKAVDMAWIFALEVFMVFQQTDKRQRYS